MQNCMLNMGTHWNITWSRDQPLARGAFLVDCLLSRVPAFFLGLLYNPPIVRVIFFLSASSQFPCILNWQVVHYLVLHKSSTSPNHLSQHCFNQSLSQFNLLLRIFQIVYYFSLHGKWSICHLLWGLLKSLSRKACLKGIQMNESEVFDLECYGGQTVQLLMTSNLFVWICSSRSRSSLFLE